MTLTTDPDLRRESADRRERATGPRRSWASTEPYVERPTPANRRAAELVRQRWHQVATRYMLVAIAVDALLAGLISAWALLSVIDTDITALAGGAFTALAFPLLVAVVRGYEPRSLGSGPGEFQSVFRGGLLLAGTLMTVAYTTQLAVPRRLVFVAVPVIVVASCVGRFVQRRLLHRIRRRGAAMMRTVVVGDDAQVRRLVGEFTRMPHNGYRIIGSCRPTIDPGVPSGDGQPPVLGVIADIPQVVSDHAADVVVVAGSALSGEALRRLSWALGHAGAELVVAPDLVEVLGPRLSLHPTSTLSLLRVEIGAPRRRLLAKAVLDRVLGTLLTLVALPVIVGAALAVRFTSPGPAFFRQTRVGVDGRTFTMLKLRSMYIDADERRAALLADTDRDGPMFKMRQDPRVTPVGRFLRKYSVDELPQLLNVVKGDMSLVGPRPPLLDEVATYHDAVFRRLHVRPGLTGLWQVSGRADLSWEESVRLDLRYVDNWSVAMDMMILWKTGRAVLGGSGAY